MRLKIMAQRRLMALDRRRLCATLSLIGAVLTALLAITSLPFVPLQPTCWDETAWSVFNPVVEVRGKMSRTFRTAYEETLSYYGVFFISLGGRIYVTVPMWLAREDLMNISNKALDKVLAARTGSNSVKISRQKLGLADFDEVHPGRWPPCSGVRKLAIRGGEWAVEHPAQLQ